MAKYKTTQKFDPNEVGDLVARAKGNETSGEYKWIAALTVEQAKAELLERFGRLVGTLANVCLTGRVNYFSHYQKSFLRIWAGKAVPLDNVATMLKQELSVFGKEELLRIGQIALLQAIDRTHSNFATTILTCYKDLLFELIKNKDSHKTQEFQDYQVPSTPFEDEVALQVDLERLPPHEYELILKYLEGEVEELPKEVIVKLRAILVDPI